MEVWSSAAESYPDIAADLRAHLARSLGPWSMLPNPSGPNWPHC
ncbi:hypothetical protein [Glycomyces halotolerans]